jgi:hypothetical protein
VKVVSVDASVWLYFDFRSLDEIQKLEDTTFSKKLDAKFKRDGIQHKIPIDSTKDTLVRKTRTRRFSRKTKVDNRKYNLVQI